jgi:hypothetical protein
MGMTPFEIRLELLRLATNILQAQTDKPEHKPKTEQVVAEAEKLNQFVSSKTDRNHN